MVPHDLTLRALDVLLDPALDPIVDMVARRLPGNGDGYEVAAADGRVRFRRAGPGVDGYEVIAVEGRDPLAEGSTDRFVGLATEQAARHPHRSANSYPFGHDHVAQLFDHPAAPDLCVLHAAAHNWAEQGGHLGEHGSLGIVQARAPFVISGRGVRRAGFVDGDARLVDVAPTIAALLGCAPLANGDYLAGQDGRALVELLDPGAGSPRTVVGFLFDGTNANVLYDMVRRGDVPNVARLVESGCALERGAFAGLPTVTLANHTSVITGRLPGHHGILHNAWYDRTRGEQVITNSSATWPWAMRHVVDGVDSLHHAVHRCWPDAFSASVNEPCDLGADYSTFDFFRRGEVPPIPESPEGLPHTTERFVRPSKDYSWSSVVDHMGIEQAVGILGGEYRDVTYPLPRFLWVNFTLTDAAMHEGGPYSEIAAAGVRDSDARLGAVLDAVERAGVYDDTAFVLVADHGMEETDPSVRGDWDVALRDAGIPFRDEGYGFLYLGDGTAVTGA